MTTVASTASEPHKVELVLGQLDSLPALSPVVAKILQLTADSKSSATEIVKLIESDPGLSARLLSVLGRAQHGMRRETLTISNAVVLLGFNAVRHLVLSTKVMEVLGPPASAGDDEGFDRSAFWRYCLGVACAARGLATSVRPALDAEEAFLSGLLHNIGIVALDAVMPKSFARIVRKSNETHENVVDVERSMLGVDHTVVGHRLADRWCLPPRLVECIWLHEQDPAALPPSVAAGRHVQIVQLAAAIVQEQRIGYSGTYRPKVSSRVLAERLGLSDQARKEVAASLVDEIEKRAEWIGLDDLQGRDVYLEALSAATDELSRTNAALTEQNCRLASKARCFAALSWLSRSLSPQASVSEACAATAEALRQALEVATVVVFAPARDRRWTEIGLSDGTSRSEIDEGNLTSPNVASESAFAAKMAVTGTWVAPPGRSFDPIVNRYRQALGTGSIWLLPLLREGTWIAGALFSADPDRVAAWHTEGSEVEAVSTAAGLAIAHAQSQASARSLAEELAAINRQWAVIQAESTRARTLETVVAMAAGAAHEMNNPLAVISGRAQMLRGRAAGEEDRRMLDMIVEQAHNCSHIVTELMDFAKPCTPKTVEIDLAELLESVRAALVSEGVLATPGLELDLPSDTPRVLFDRDQLSRTFRELVRNAVAATDPADRRLTVKARVNLAEKSLVVAMIDNGCGMKPEVLERAMDPFFSHQPAGRRRGLGLARVHQWIRQNGGDVRIESRAGQGTRVELRLPIADAANGHGDSATGT